MAAIQNILLASLPRKEYLKLLPGLTPVTLEFGAVLFEPGDRMRDVYFPSGCLVSLLRLVESHQALEVGMVGQEGMVGVPLALGVDMSEVRALVQGGGPALRMSGAKFRSALRRSPALLRAVNAYIHVLLGQISQTAACNRFHVVNARLARWLLMTRDRLKTGEFRLTQDFLSHMLGVRREGVTEAASDFQKRKLIDYSRGQIVILDHYGLEAAACSCYKLSGTGSKAIAPWRPTVHRVSRVAPAARPPLRRPRNPGVAVRRIAADPILS